MFVCVAANNAPLSLCLSWSQRILRTTRLGGGSSFRAGLQVDDDGGYIVRRAVEQRVVPQLRGGILGAADVRLYELNLECGVKIKDTKEYKKYGRRERTAMRSVITSHTPSHAITMNSS